MSDPRVNSCPDQKETEDSGKIRCIFPGRPYYFCKTNRKEGVCPHGLSTTYDDPEIKPTRPFKSSLEEQTRYFHEHHETSRWNLKNRFDAYLLYYQLDTLQFRYLELSMMLQREGRYKDAHHAWGKHDAYNLVMHDLFPYRDGGGRNLSDDYGKIQKQILELESMRVTGKGESEAD